MAVRSPAATRLRVALVLACVALLAAVIGALGPAERVRTSYSWPPAVLPAASPTSAWYTPLLLVKHRPEAIAASVPCTLPPPLPGAGEQVTVLASARRPERSGGFALTAEGDLLSLAVGGSVLERVGLAGGGSGGDCEYRLSFEEGRWTLEGGPQGIARGGALAELPVVFGLFSELDLRAGEAPAVDVRSDVHATRTIARQAVAWTLAALALAAALLLVALERRPRPAAALRGGFRTALGRAHPVDAVVGLVLAGWWLLSPAFFDDGWIYAKQSMFSASRGFSSYFVMFGTNAPLGYWLDWLQHWLTQSTSVLVVLRLPALLCLAATWVVCRYVLSRVLASSVGESPVALWSLASAFLVGALAWGMTLRPEPLTALLVTGVAACMIRFLERRTATPLVLVAVLVPLALSAHPSGIVSLAPVLVAAPELVRWIRPRLQAAVTVVTASLALLVVLSFVGADLEQRRLDAAAFRSYGSVSDWSDELVRYELLSAFPYGTPLRRLTVALMALAIVAFLVRLVRRERHGVLGFPSGALTIGVALLVATPSKWPWHFGTLIGFIALAVASETAWFRNEQSRARGWRLWPFAAVAAAVLSGAWAWGMRTSWNLVDLRTLDWHPGFEGRVSLLDLAILLPLLAAGGAVLLAIARGRRGRRYEEPWRVASWTAPLLAVPTIAFTVAVLLADTGRTESWTLARENVAAIGGAPGCGLAEDVLVPDLASARALPSAGAGGARPPAWVPPAPAAALSRYVLDATGTPWFELPASRRFGVFVAGVPGPTESLVVEWGRTDAGRVAPLGVDRISSVIAELPESGPWQFYVSEELPAPPGDATVVRVAFRADPEEATPIAVTAPVTYSSGPLARRLASPATRTLVHPDLLPYFPCARLPRLRDGLSEPASYLVAAGHPSLPRGYVLSPLAGLADVYDVERLSTADSDNPPERVFVYEVDEAAGAKSAPAVASPSG